MAVLDSIPGLFYNQVEVNRQKKTPLAKQSIGLLVLVFIIFFTPSKKATCQETYIRLKVVADQANIRLEPDISSIIIRQVPEGTILNATEKRDEWFAVQLTSKQGAVVSGYVHESLVTPIEPLPEEKKPLFIPKTKPVKTEEDQPISPFRFALSITGGGNSAHGGDFNLGIKGLVDLNEDILGIQGEGNIGPVHMGYIIGLEVSFPLSEKLSWGIGAEHFHAGNESRVVFTQGTISTELIVQPILRATPLSLFLSFNPIPELYVKGGISYYFAGCSYTYLFQADDLSLERKGRANARGLGLTGGIGFLKSLSSNLSFIAEITGRLAKIQGFTGKEDFQDSSGEIATEEGTLYIIQAQVLEERTHDVLFIRETRPNEAGIISAHEAQIDFSGIGLKIGLRIHF